MSSRVPPLLEPYISSSSLSPPESHLTLITSVLGASSNWLVLRHLYALLKASSVSRGVGESGEAGEANGVVLVSFLRDLSFWREGASKLGLDVDALGKTGRFVFVDGLTGTSPGKKDVQRGGEGRQTHRVLTSNQLDHVRGEIEGAMADLKPSRRILVVDQPDVLLAISDQVTSLALQNTLLSLRDRAHAAILTLSADDPLLHTQTTTLEREHASLVTSQAHGANLVMSLRVLDTGTAKDVSGVIRITPGGAGSGQDGGDGDGERRSSSLEEREYLYFVGGDGNVKVFERGA